ncbi:MAG: TolC family protein [Deltaproteobacteria bacterium]|nr:TolC family protein [Deltaproteobacteria bacterium]
MPRIKVSKCARRRSYAWFAALFGLLAAPSFAAFPAAHPNSDAPIVPQQMTLANALDLFRSHGFDLLIADAETARSRGELVSAAAFPNPQLQGSAGTAFNYSCASGARGCSTTMINGAMSDQGLIADIFIGKRRLRVAVAQKALAIAQLNRSDAERNLTFLVKQQYAQAVMNKEALRAASEAAQMSAETARLVGVRFQAGAVSEADVARADTERLEAQQAVDTAGGALATSKASLAFLIGVRSSSADFELVDDLRPVPQLPLLTNASIDSLLPIALERRPDLQAAQTEIDRAAAAVDLARRQRVPDIALFATYQSQGSGQDSVQPPTLSFGLSLPLPLLYRQQGEIAVAEAQRQVDLEQHRKTEAQIRADVATALAAYQSARRRLERMDSTLLGRARRARDLVEVQYQKGAASLLELLDAQRTFVATTNEYHQTLTDYWTSLFLVEAAVGKDLGA